MFFKTVIRQKQVTLKSLVLYSAIVLAQLVLISCAYSRPQLKLPQLSGPVIIDHNSTDLAQIPDKWIDGVKSNVKWHYAHTSHGNQLLTGLRTIMRKDPKYAASIGNRFLPVAKNALCVFDGQKNYRGVTPERYWSSEEGRRSTLEVLDYYPKINVSMWSWCRQLDKYSKAQLQSYLEAMDIFQAKHPDVMFVYMTGNAQAGSRKGYNRYLRNNQLRDWIKNNPKKNRILFDFADLDSWWYNPVLKKWEQATYQYSDGAKSIDIPIEHPHFHGRKEFHTTYACHTTYESCEQKGKAVWWMMAILAGWEPNTPE